MNDKEKLEIDNKQTLVDASLEPKEAVEQEDVAAIDGLSEEEDILNRLQLADIRLEQLEDIPTENRSEEQDKEYNELKALVKELKLKQKEMKITKKEGTKEASSIWEKLSIAFVIYGVISFLLVMYPLGTMLSAYWANVSFKISSSIAEAIEMSDGMLSVVNFLFYLLYYLIFIIGVLLVYIFSKKTKLNLWTFIVLLVILVGTSLFSILKVVGVFFQ